MDGSTRGRRKTRHYDYSEVIQIALGQRKDPFKHTDNCPVCAAHKAAAIEIEAAAKKAMEETT